jgi:hypothetical protein
MAIFSSNYRSACFQFFVSREDFPLVNFSKLNQPMLSEHNWDVASANRRESVPIKLTQLNSNARSRFSIVTGQIGDQLVVQIRRVENFPSVVTPHLPFGTMALKRT